jgi:oxygen-independent coproporphyrinogen-3 oxidase
MQAVMGEVDMVAQKLPTKMKVRHIHFGGGSPTILEPEDFVRTIDRLRERFDVKPDAEIAVEMDPRTATEEYVIALKRAGVTRASLGVQDFDPKVQEAINRIQPYDITAQTVAWLRQYDIPEINMDLIYGLPFQTLDGLLHTIDLAVGFQPKRIALFGYAHVPWMKKHQRLIPPESLPDTAARWEQYEQACKRLVEHHGYVQIGLDHFALPDDEMAVALAEKRLNRNFQGYTTDTATVLVAFGASGIGSLPQGYVANMGEIHFYQQAVAEGRLPIQRGVSITEDDRLRRRIIERLMCDLEVDLDKVAAEYGRSGGEFSDELTSLTPMIADGLITIDGHTIHVTHDGRTLVRAVGAAFDKYLKHGEQRHSKAV